MTTDGEPPDTPTGEAMRAYNERISSVTIGMSAAAVRSVLGNPDSIIVGKPEDGPSATFASLGLRFDFGESGADEVWAFCDPYRPRRTNCFAFRSGRVCSSWRDTRSAATLG